MHLKTPVMIAFLSLVRFATARDVDPTFTASATAGTILTSARGMALQRDGKVIVTGNFTLLSGHATTNVGRLNIDGSVDTNFIASISGDIFGVAVQEDGKLIIGGQFGRSIARLNSDGSLDSSFTTVADLTVRNMALQADGNLIVVGDFRNLGGFPHVRIARISPGGTVDNSFQPSANNVVWTAAVRANGRILVGGSFTNLCGESRNRLGQLNPNGTLDVSFTPGVDGVNGQINALRELPDGKILVGGTFTNLAGGARRNFGRLNSDGTLDSTFDSSNVLSVVTSIALQSDGAILVASGNLAYEVDRASGAATPLFTPAANDLLRALLLQRDGKLFIAGNFTTVGGQSHNRIARLTGGDEGEEAVTIDATGSTMTWSRVGSGPDVEHVVFERSFDGVNFTLLGFPSRVMGGWHLAGLSLPTGQFMDLRARGFTAGGLFNGSSSLIESVKHFDGVPGPQLFQPYLSNGTFQFNSLQDTGVTFSVFTTTNLNLPASMWTQIGSPMYVSNRVFQFTDIDATNHPQRFYQLRVSP